MKKIDTSKYNDILELSGVDKSMWRLFSAIYNSGWDSLFADQSKNLFRQKVTYKCTPAIKPMINSKKEGKPTDKPVSIKRIPSPILVKSPKEVKEISRYFKTTKQLNNTKSYNILYA